MSDPEDDPVFQAIWLWLVGLIAICIVGVVALIVATVFEAANGNDEAIEFIIELTSVAAVFVFPVIVGWMVLGLPDKIRGWVK